MRRRSRPQRARITALLASFVFLPGGALAAATTGGSAGPKGATGSTGLTGLTGLTGTSGSTAKTGTAPRVGATGASLKLGSTGRAGPAPKLGSTSIGSVTRLSGAALLHLQHKMSAAMRTIGHHSGAYAVDLATGQVLFSDSAASGRYPASVEKLFTLTTALARFGLGGTLSTGVYAVGRLDADHVLHGDLYLRGGGDPTFGDASFIKSAYGVGTSVQSVAQQLVRLTGIRRIDGSVIGDESSFDTRRGGPSTHFQPDSNLVGLLSALAFNRGLTGAEPNPAAYSALRFAQALRHLGVQVHGRSHAGETPAEGSVLLLSVPSPPMSVLAGLTARPSDDFFAEMILKALGAKFGGAGTTAAGAQVVSQYLASIGIHPRVADGSGLSRQDVTTAAQVVHLLEELSPGGSLQAIGTTLHAALPVVGESGTLITRMHGTSAVGRCVAKTGTLSNASDLAGWCDGRYAFALLMNNVNVYTAMAAQDQIVEALAALP